MKSIIALVVLIIAMPLVTGCTEEMSAKPSQPQNTAAQRIERGEYLVNLGGCNDCHTPWVMGPNGPAPDMTRALSGHPANLVMPTPPKMDGPWVWSAAGTNTAFAGPWGISYGRNLTPDQVSGLGIWTEAMFLKTMRLVRHMRVSRPILAPMPWENLNHLTDEDLMSIYAYLRTVKPVRNEVPDPIIAPPPAATPAS